MTIRNWVYSPRVWIVAFVLELGPVLVIQGLVLITKSTAPDDDWFVKDSLNLFWIFLRLEFCVIGTLFWAGWLLLSRNGFIEIGKLCYFHSEIGFKFV